jgi:hypothetical protein
VPAERRFLIGEDFKISLNGLMVNTVTPDKGGTKDEARKFMMDTFFREAAVPSALGLLSNRAAVERELDMYLGSGFSVTVHNEASKELVGCYACTSWNKEPNYDIVENVTMAQWHNTAAEIAMEENPKHPQVSGLLLSCLSNLNVFLAFFISSGNLA